jgi:hypothetical protein
VQRYALTLPGEPGRNIAPRVVVVHWTPALVGGEPVYEDLRGSFRAVIGPDGVARLLGPHGGVQEPCLQAIALP